METELSVREEISPGGDGAAAGHRVLIAGDGASFVCPPGEVMLRAALRTGLGFPHECNVGGCGNCRYELLEGEVETLWNEAPGLSERDRARGRRLACQSRPLTDCTVKLRLMPQYRPPIVPVAATATLLGRRTLTHDMHEFRFRPDRDMRFLPGQYALLDLPGVPGVRAYSMANVPEASGEWHFIVRRVPGGQGTQALFERLGVGDRIGLDGPYGMAYLQEDAPRDVVCIAGGSGLAPMLSIARGMARAGMLGVRSLDFFFGGRSPRDIAGGAEIGALAQPGARVRFHACVSQAEIEDGWDGNVGMVHEHVQAVLGAQLASSEVYFAGPARMGEAVLAMLVQAGVPASQIHYDRYF